METNYFASNIRYLRRKARMSQEAFGKQIGRAKATICMYENGARSPVLEDVFTLADFFGLRVNDLLTVDLENTNGYVFIHSDDLKDIDPNDVKMIAAILKAVKEK